MLSSVVGAALGLYVGPALVVAVLVAAGGGREARNRRPVELSLNLKERVKSTLA